MLISFQKIAPVFSFFQIYNLHFSLLIIYFISFLFLYKAKNKCSFSNLLDSSPFPKSLKVNNGCTSILSLSNFNLNLSLFLSLITKYSHEGLVFLSGLIKSTVPFNFFMQYSAFSFLNLNI